MHAWQVYAKTARKKIFYALILVCVTLCINIFVSSLRDTTNRINFFSLAQINKYLLSAWRDTEREREKEKKIIFYTYVKYHIFYLYITPLDQPLCTLNPRYSYIIKYLLTRGRISTTSNVYTHDTYSIHVKKKIIYLKYIYLHVNSAPVTYVLYVLRV